MSVDMQGVVEYEVSRTAVCTGEDIDSHEGNKNHGLRPADVAQIVPINSRVSRCSSEIINIIRFRDLGCFLFHHRLCTFLQALICCSIG